MGGTKTLLRLTKMSNDNIVEYHEETFISAKYSHLRDIVEPFIRDIEVQSACFAVAGPVSGDNERQSALITNLPWQLDSDDLSRDLKIPTVKLINDFQAIGYGIDNLTPDNLICIQGGDVVDKANRAIIGAGTGLGQAFMTYGQGGYKVHATEGGHVEFAPNNVEEIALLAYLQQNYAHVSYERILSGSGLINIYEFMKDRYPELIDPSLDAQFKHGDAAAIISQTALKNPAHIAAKALSMFVTIYGAQAGNMVLNYNCTGGVYIAGGIAGKIESVMNSDIFRQAFNNKGRMSGLTLKIPVFLITDARVGLYGAENIAIHSIA